MKVKVKVMLLWPTFVVTKFSAGTNQFRRRRRRRHRRPCHRRHHHHLFFKCPFLPSYARV